MGIEGLDILKPDGFPQDRPVREHKIDTEYHTWIVGWDPSLQSFFLKRFDKNDVRDNTPDIYVTDTAETPMRVVNDLVQAARANGLVIDLTLQKTLYREQGDSRLTA